MQWRLLPTRGRSDSDSGVPRRSLAAQDARHRRHFWRGVVAIVVLRVLWEIGARVEQWFGFPSPSSACCRRRPRSALAWSKVLTQVGLLGELVPELPARPAGLRGRADHRHPVRPDAGGETGTSAKSSSRLSRSCGPIPPLAWVPASLIFWPTNELSIAFVTFLGAFFTIVINVARRRTHHRHPLPAGRPVDGRQPMGPVLEHHPARHATLDFHRRGRRHGHHLGGGGRRRDDLRRWHAGRRRPRFLHLELLHRRLVAPDRRRHDLDRHCRLSVEHARSACSAIAPCLGGTCSDWSADDAKTDRRRGRSAPRGRLALRAMAIQGRSSSGRQQGLRRGGERQEVIKDLSLEIAPGELTVVVGPSGCGKTTLVNLIAGYERPDEGEILLERPARSPGRPRTAWWFSRKRR